MPPHLRPLRLLLLCALSGCVGDKEGGSTDTGLYDPDGGDGVDGADGGDGADGATDGTDGTATLCEDSTPILLEDGSASGFERCADGSVHRVSVEEAPVDVPADRCEGDEYELYCMEDADCTDRPNGACVSQYPTWAEYDSCACVYACGSDIDCDGGEICLPADIVEGDESWSTCVQATCTTDADCASGECGVDSWFDGCGWVTGAGCRDAAEDTCRSDADCEATGEDCGQAWGFDGAFTCHTEECAIGRPLLVEDAARTAPAVARPDWAESCAVAVPDSASLRGQLAARWARVAALEHASVGSFARFTLQLLALGAPPELLAEVQAAAADEVAHARVAFGLAAAYGGAAVGPGPLDLAGAAPALDPRGVMRGLVDEACVGETVGAAEAAEAARRCADPVVKAHLQCIADDEARHAALAWRALRWLLTEHPALRDEARARLLDAAARLAAAPTRDDRGLAPYGLLGGAEQSALRAAVVREVVAPCVAAV